MGIEKFETIITCKNMNECIEYPAKKKARVNTRRVLEELTDRACKQGLWDSKTLSEFTDWLRGLYPELYTKKSA